MAIATLLLIVWLSYSMVSDATLVVFLYVRVRFDDIASFACIGSPSKARKPSIFDSLHHLLGYVLFIVS